MSATQAFLYPEELLLVEDPGGIADLVAELGIDGVSLAVIYHRARRYFPRYGAVSTTGGGVLAVQPGSGYGDLMPTAPPAGLDAAVRRFRDACDRRGLSFGAWVVGLHSEPLVEARPDLGACWSDGSPTGFALCPSQAEVLAYLTALVRDVEAQLAPDAVDLEAWAYPAWDPAYTLTLALEPVPEERRHELAVCGCAACRELPGADREARVGEVLSELRSAVPVPVRPLVFGPVDDLGGQGITRRSLDGAAVGAGTGVRTGGALVERVRDLTVWLGRPPALVSTNWAPERTADGMAVDAAAVAAEGVATLALYNLSLVPERGLPALAAAAAGFRETGA